VFAVADEQEARELIVLACSTNGHGEYVADELVHEQTLENLQRFSERLGCMHEILRKNGRCRCDATPPTPPKPPRRKRTRNV
jgi:hypothetical protein